MTKNRYDSNLQMNHELKNPCPVNTKDTIFYSETGLFSRSLAESAFANPSSRVALNLSGGPQKYYWQRLLGMH